MLTTHIAHSYNNSVGQLRNCCCVRGTTFRVSPRFGNATAMERRTNV